MPAIYIKTTGSHEVVDVRCHFYRTNSSRTDWGSLWQYFRPHHLCSCSCLFFAYIFTITFIVPSLTFIVPSLTLIIPSLTLTIFVLKALQTLLTLLPALHKHLPKSHLPP